MCQWCEEPPVRTDARTNGMLRVAQRHQAIAPEQKSIARSPKAGGEAERKRSAKVGRRMAARATGRPLPVVSATHAHSRHQSKDHIDASVARRGALPWPARPRGIAHSGIAVSIARVAAVAAAPLTAE